MLSHGHEVKSTLLESQFYYKETAGEMGSFDPSTSNNDSVKYRYKKSKNSQYVEMMAPLSLDMFKQERLLFPGIKGEVEFTMNDSSFYLLTPDADPNYLFYIEELVLYVRRVKVSDAVKTSHDTQLRNTSLKYPTIRTKCVAYNNGVSQNFSENIAKRIPRRVVFCGTA